MKITCPHCKRRLKIRKNDRCNICKCGYHFKNKIYWNINQVYLIDANILIYALDNNKYRGEHSRNLFNHFTIGITHQVLNEVKNKDVDKLPLKIYKTIISDELHDLTTNTFKKPSMQDKSLIQCAIDNPEIVGIITNDMDIKNLVPTHLIKGIDSFFIGRPYEILKKFGY